MKKTLIFAISTVILNISCSENNDNNNSTPYIEPSLENSILSPASVNVTGINKTINFELKTNGVTMKNSDFNWSISNEDIGHIDNKGNFSSQMIGNAVITVKDNKSKSISANVIVNPSVTDIPDVPFIKWGSFSNEIINNVSGWTLVSSSNVNTEYKKGTWSLKYILDNMGLWQVQLSSSESQFNSSDKFMSYNSERFKVVQPSDPNNASWARWFFLNPNGNNNVYVDIVKISNTSYYLRYKKN